MDRSQVWILILAAGQSERFGGVKALANWGRGNLLSNAINLAEEINPQNICVVLGGHVDPLIPFLQDKFYSVNPNWENGMGTSIAWGVQKIVERDPSVKQILILPLDQPLIRVEHLKSLIQTSEENQKNTLTESTSDTLKIQGPPAVLHHKFFKKILDLQDHRGLKFILEKNDYDVVVNDDALKDIDTPEDLERLHSFQFPPNSTSVFVASYATKLSLIEIILGSVVHGLNIPFGGSFLSLNQGVFLCRATDQFAYDRKAAAFIPLQVSSVSAVLKSLSPAGQKLGPMIAISMQGFLYSLTILFLGPSRIVQSLGMVLLGLWSFIQPILMLWIFYGESLPKAALFFYDRLKQTVPAVADIFIYVLIGIVVLKSVVAAALPWVLSFMGVDRFDVFTDRVSEKAVKYMPKTEREPAKNQWQAFRRTFRDLTRPAFFIPCLLVTFFLFFSETKNAQWIWKLMRPLAVATIFFYLTNTPWMHRLSTYLRTQGYFPQFFSILDQTKENLSRKRHESLKSVGVTKKYSL